MKHLMFLLAFAASACGNSNKGTDTGNAAVILGSSVTVTPAGALSMALTSEPVAAGLRVTDTSGNELVITGAEIVLRAIEFKRAESAGCVEESDCEEFSTAPLVLPLPLDGSFQVVAEAVVAPGVYDEIDFELHKISAADAATLGRPDLADISIRLQGEYNNQARTFENDLNVEKEVQLTAPLNLMGGDATSVALQTDVAHWFEDAAGNLIDPATANVGGANQSEVEENIKLLFRGFEDPDRDGKD